MEITGLTDEYIKEIQREWLHWKEIPTEYKFLLLAVVSEEAHKSAYLQHFFKAAPLYVWDVKILRFRDRSTGRLVAFKTVHGLLDTMEKVRAVDAERLAQAFVAGSSNESQWRESTLALLRKVHVQATALSVGGYSQITPKMLLQIEQALAEDAMRMRGVTAQTPNLLGRVRLWVGNGRASYWRNQPMPPHNQRTEEVLERRILKPGDSCQFCIEQAGLGWQSPGVLSAPGTVPDPPPADACYTNCRCTRQRKVVDRKDVAHWIGTVKSWDKLYQIAASNAQHVLVVGSDRGEGSAKTVFTLWDREQAEIVAMGDLEELLDAEVWTWKSDNFSRENPAKGGPGSGNFGHSGRPGKVGGSSMYSALDESLDLQEWAHGWSIPEEDMIHVEDILNTYGFHSQRINRVLRDSGSLEELTIKVRSGKYTEEEYFAWKSTTDLRNVMRGLPDDLILYRGVSGEYAERIRTLKERDVVRELGFTSTSPRLAQAANFTDALYGSQGVFMEIRAPKGTAAVFIGQNKSGSGGIRFESEVLLRNDLKFEFIGNRQGEFGPIFQFQAILPTVPYAISPHHPAWKEYAKGGPGSGNFGHAGRPGLVGGSTSQESGVVLKGGMSQEKANELLGPVELSFDDIRFMYEIPDLKCWVGVGSAFHDTASGELKLVVNVYAQYTDEKGNKVGEILRDYIKEPTGELRANNGGLEIDSTYMQKGIGRSLYDKQIGTLRKKGYSRITLLANVSIGTYAWAKMGFVYKQGQIASVRSNFENWAYYKQIDISGIDLSTFKTPLDFADLKIPGVKVPKKKIINPDIFPGEYEVGKAFMLDGAGHQQWLGELFLQ